MSKTRYIAPETPLASDETLFDVGGALDTLLRFQQQQWNLLLTWQQALAGAQQDFWDQWICRWGGGVPIDG